MVVGPIGASSKPNPCSASLDSSTSATSISSAVKTAGTSKGCETMERRSAWARKRSKTMRSWAACMSIRTSPSAFWART